MKHTLFAATKLAVGLAASDGLGWFAMRGLDWGDVCDTLEGVLVSLVLLSLIIFMAASYLRVLRWQVLYVNERPGSDSR